MSMLYYNEKLLYQRFGRIAGVDEAGRGPLAGPLVVAACILHPEKMIPGLNDSKKIAEKKRDYFYEQVLISSLDYSIVIVSSEEIDRLNILAATLQGMKEAVGKLRFEPDLVLIDGNRVPSGLPCARGIVKGDSKYASIAAASILAKVTRDRIMRDLHQVHPDYNFLKNKGYPTKEHIDALSLYGITIHHRRSYSPVKSICLRNSHRLISGSEAMVSEVAQVEKEVSFDFGDKE
jgi:ribonuclease HII